MTVQLRKRITFPGSTCKRPKLLPTVAVLVDIQYIFNVMPRRKKQRRCRKFEGSEVFKPAGTPLSQLPVTEVELDELEAMRLCDKEGLDQTEAAEEMNISRGTLQRLLYSGRQKVVDSFINTKAITFQAGPHIRERETDRGRGRRDSNR